MILFFTVFSNTSMADTKPTTVMQVTCNPVPTLQRPHILLKYILLSIHVGRQRNTLKKKNTREQCHNESALTKLVLSVMLQ